MGCRTRSTPAPPSRQTDSKHHRSHGTHPGKDPCMNRITQRLFAALAVVALTAFVAACGSSSSEKSGSSSSKNAGNPNTGKKGGKLEQLGASDVDFLAPGQPYSAGGYRAPSATQKPVYFFKPGVTTQSPDLAAGPPKLSDDKKTVTV